MLPWEQRVWERDSQCENGGESEEKSLEGGFKNEVVGERFREENLGRGIHISEERIWCTGVTGGEDREMWKHGGS